MNQSEGIVWSCVIGAAAIATWFLPVSGEVRGWATFVAVLFALERFAEQPR